MRDLLSRTIDARRAVSLVLGLLAYCLGALGLAVTPGLLTAGWLDATWPSATAPILGGAIGFAIRGYAFHHQPGSRTGLWWALAQGGVMFVAITALIVLVTVIRPIVAPNQTLGGDSWLGLLGLATVVGLSSNVLWERNRRRQRIAALFLVAACLIIAGVAVLRAGGTWTPFGTALIVVGVLAVFLAVSQGIAELWGQTAETAT